MNDWIHWLLGIRESPDLVEGGSWSLRCQALPEGAAAVALVACAALAAWGVWWLYRLEGRSIALATRWLLVGLRLAVLACVAGMLLEVVLVITKPELIPARLLVLIDDSASMGLKDPYAARRPMSRPRKLTANSLRSRRSASEPAANWLAKR